MEPPSPIPIPVVAHPESLSTRLGPNSVDVSLRFRNSVAADGRATSPPQLEPAAAAVPAGKFQNRNADSSRRRRNDGLDNFR